MKKWMFFYIILLFCAQTTVWGQDDYTERANRYIEQHKNLAILEQQRSGVPAAVTLAQGILETAAGNSELMTQANNHFGIKCRKEWQGETFSHDDDAPNECFRKYSCAQDSYKDHSDYLRTGPRYAALFQLSPTDYSGWANGLKRCGYATNPRYAQQLIKIIEDFHLQDYTYLAMSKARTSAPVAVSVVPAQTTNKVAQNDNSTNNSQAAATTVEQPAKQETPKASGNSTDDGKVIMVNGLRAFHARKGDVLLEKAIKYNVRYARLLEINDLPDAPLEADMFIYLEKKNSKGAHSTHVMQQGETLLQVAQAEGVQLKQIRSFNQLESNETPVVGTILRLQEPTSRKPELVASNTPMASSPVVKGQNDDQTVYFFKKSSSNSPKKAAEPVKEVTRPVAVAPQVTKPVETPPAPVFKPAETIAATPQVTKPVEVPPTPVSKPAETIAAAPQVNNTVATKETTANTSKTEEVNIANEKAVEEEIEGRESVDTETVAAKQEEEEPQDELSRLKRKLDKAVYGKNEQRPSQSNIKTTEATKPIASSTPTTTPETSKTTADDGSKIYIVQKGDTAFNIAKRHNITMRQLMDWNNLNFQAIKPGMKLRVKP